MCETTLLARACWRSAGSTPQFGWGGEGGEGRGGSGGRPRAPGPAGKPDLDRVFWPLCLVVTTHRGVAPTSSWRATHRSHRRTTSVNAMHMLRTEASSSNRERQQRGQRAGQRARMVRRQKRVIRGSACLSTRRGAPHPRARHAELPWHPPSGGGGEGGREEERDRERTTYKNAATDSQEVASAICSATWPCSARATEDRRATLAGLRSDSGSSPTTRRSHVSASFPHLPLTSSTKGTRP